MKSILIIPGYKLFPIETGAGVAQYGIIDTLRAHMSVTLLIHDDNVSSEHLSVLMTQWPEVEFLHWADLKVAWESTYQPSIWSRVKGKLGLGQTEEVTQPVLDVPAELESEWHNASIVFVPIPTWMGASLDYHLQSTRYDVIQNDLHATLALFERATQRDTPIVHVCHELKHKRLQRAAEALGLAHESKTAISAIAYRERKLLNTYDKVICFAQDDIDALQPMQASLSPFPVLDSDFYSGERSAVKRLMFLGPEAHGPNREGLLWFIEHIYQQLPDPPRLEVIGRWSQETITSCASYERIQFRGFVDDLSPYFDDSAMIAPVRSGAGVRTKIIQAMAQQVPVISTRFAAQGIGAQSGESIMYFEQAEDFIAAWKKLQDKEQLESIRECAQEHILSRFSQEYLGGLRLAVLNSLIK